MPNGGLVTKFLHLSCGYVQLIMRSWLLLQLMISFPCLSFLVEGQVMQRQQLCHTLCNNFLSDPSAVFLGLHQSLRRPFCCLRPIPRELYLYISVIAAATPAAVATICNHLYDLRQEPGCLDADGPLLFSDKLLRPSEQQLTVRLSLLIG